MKPKYSIKIASILLVLTICSCTKLLNEAEPTSIITAESFWKTPGDAKGALAGMYVYLRGIADASLYALGEARSGIVNKGMAGENWALYYDNSLSPSNAGVDWSGLYTLVNSANLILKYVPNIDFPSQDTKDDILAQAYAMRAFAYFVMVRTWGALPIHTEPTEGTDASVTQVPRSSEKEVFSLIKSDLDKAIDLFPSNGFPECRCEWSKPATNALKGDVYLWTGKVLNGGKPDFQIALDALTQVQQADVRLLPKFSNIFDFSNKGNDEMVMAVRFKEFETGDNFFRQMYIHVSEVPASISDYTRNRIAPVGGGNSILLPAKFVRDQFGTDDSRRDATFYDIYEYNSPSDSAYITTIQQKGLGVVTGGTRKFISDVILYRYGGILLMIAEAKNALGMDPSVEINEIRKRAYGNNYASHVFVNGSQEANDAAILKERLLELSYEGGKRWWDLIRFGKAFDLVPSLKDRKGEDYLLLWPISLHVLSLEPKVKQNPGWGD